MKKVKGSPEENTLEQGRISKALEICKGILNVSPTLGHRADTAITKIVKVLQGKEVSEW